MAQITCSTEGCAKPSKKRGLCEAHYQSARNATLGTCSQDGCDRKVKAVGLCNQHYLIQRAGGVTCSVEGCDGLARTRGFCSMHYYRWNKTGEAGEAALRRKPPRPCVVEGCENMAVTSRDLCPTHARRKRLYGTEHGTFVTHQKCVVCGEKAMHGPQSSEHCEQHYWDLLLDRHLAGEAPGIVSPKGYVYLSVRKKYRAVHRLVMARAIERRLRSFETPHHMNGIKSDNRVENLELWTKPQPAGQRPGDLVAWVVEFYRDLVIEHLNKP